MVKKVESRIVQGVGIAVMSGVSGDATTAARLEKALSDTVLEAQAEGIALDSDELKERMREVREKILAEREAAEAERAARETAEAEAAAEAAKGE